MSHISNVVVDLITSDHVIRNEGLNVTKEQK